MDEITDENEMLAKIQSEIDEIEQKISQLKSQKSELLGEKKFYYKFSGRKISKTKTRTKLGGRR